MALKKWQVKRLLMAPFMQSEIGSDIYEWLTAVVMGTQRGMSRKWCCWFREHVVLCRRYSRISLQDKRIWLFHPGWSLAPVLLARIATGKGPTVTEDRKRLARQYLPVALGEVEKAAPQICQSGRLDQDSIELLDKVRSVNSPERVLTLCSAQYLVLNLNNLQTMPDASQDICMSMGRLEHFTEDQLGKLFKQMSRILVPGGIGSHIVDHRDHYWHYDKSIHCFQHLTYSEKEWSKIARGRKRYRNRMVEKDYVAIFKQCNFELLACIHELHRDDAKGVQTRTFWGPFRQLTEEDLQAAVSHFIVRRK